MTWRSLSDERPGGAWPGCDAMAVPRVLRAVLVGGPRRARDGDEAGGCDQALDYLCSLQPRL